MAGTAVWSCYSDVSGSSAHARYDDVLEHRYSYDSNVINHRQVAAGDLLLIRDESQIYGYAAVEEITEGVGSKSMLRCPACNRAGPSVRTTITPRYRCTGCAHQFGDEIRPVDEIVMVFTARYGATWFPFASPVPLSRLDEPYLYRDRQNAIRRLDAGRTLAFLRHHTTVDGHLYLELASHLAAIQGGHVDAPAQRRVGQQRFRELLLKRFGAACAVTGEQPAEVLDAAHLYSYAENPVHEEDGGLLLRADLHRMFDRFLLTFDPGTWRSHVAPGLLRSHDRLRAFEDVPISLPEHLRPDRRLVERHNTEALLRWRGAA